MNIRTIVLPLATLVTVGAGCSKTTPSNGSDPSAQVPASSSNVVEAPVPRASAAGLGTSLEKAPGTYSVDSGHSQIVFIINHLGASNQYGQFTQVEGSFTINPKEIAASTIEIKVPTASVFTAVSKRDDHLRSPDFFDSKQFPAITFKSKSVAATGANSYTAHGELSMHGVTKPVDIELTHNGAAVDPEIMGGKFRTGFNGKLAVKRTDFGMTYMVGGLGDEVTLLFAIEGTRS